MDLTKWKTRAKTWQDMTEETGRTENIMVESEGGSELSEQAKTMRYMYVIGHLVVPTAHRQHDDVEGGLSSPSPQSANKSTLIPSR